MSDRLDQIRARLDAATPGPWARPDWSPVNVLPELWADDVDDPAERGEFMCIYATKEADAEFIAAAPDDIEWLLDYANGAGTAATERLDVALREKREADLCRAERDEYARRIAVLRDTLTRFVEALSNDPDPIVRARVKGYSNALELLDAGDRTIHHPLEGSDD